MKISRFYCEKIEGDSVELDPVESHHLMHVMRLKTGSKLELFDGNGIIAPGTVAKTSKKKVRIDIQGIEKFEPPQKSRVIIAAAIAKGQNFDLMVTKCTELGADFIVPLIFERSVKQASGNSVLDRYKKLSIVAAKQCGRIFLPKIAAPADLTCGLEFFKERFPQLKSVYGSLSNESADIYKVFDPESDILAFIGPEGGITTEEVKKIEEFGAVKVRLTNTILRTETACIAFTSILCTLRDGQLSAKVL